jgi:hypothetical protein
MLVDAELASLPEDERLDAQEAHMARKPGGRPRLDALTPCFVQKLAEDPEKEISAQRPGHRPRTTTARHRRLQLGPTAAAVARFRSTSSRLRWRGSPSTRRVASHRLERM